LYTFEGNLTFEPNAKDDLDEDEKRELEKYADKEINIPLDANQMLLRGSCLRNTDFIYGIVVYTGHDSKIMMNSPNCKNKLSKIESKTNKLIIYALLIELIIVTFATVYQVTWNHRNREESEFYLGWSLSQTRDASSVTISVFKGLGTWLLMFSDFVPISLLVTLEFIKFFQAIFITYDANIFDETKDMFAKVQSSNLTEELGQVQYIFSDKTGTLTQNVMEFKKMSIGSFTYGISDSETFNNYSDTVSAQNTEEIKENN
jgi:phospholipid-transporting ATPase